MTDGEEGKEGCQEGKGKEGEEAVASLAGRSKGGATCAPFFVFA
jgi:hypothetical protein